MCLKAKKEKLTLLKMEFVKLDQLTGSTQKTKLSKTIINLEQLIKDDIAHGKNRRNHFSRAGA